MTLDSVIGLFPVARGAAHFDFPKAGTRPAAITTASRLLTRIPAAHPRVAVPTATGGNFGGVGVASDSNFKDIYTNLQYRFNLERDKESRNAIQAAGPTGPRDHCRSSKLNAAEFSMQEALSLDSRALHGVVFDRSARPRNEWKRLDCQDPGVNLRPILTANESSSELEIVKPRLYSGDAAHQVAAEK